MSVSPYRIGIFSELSETEIDRLREACDEVAFNAGARIIADGARVDGLYVVISGAASVLKFSGSKAEIELARLHAGEHFGEMSLVADRPASASVRAKTDMVCLFASRERFDRILRDNPEIARKVLTAFVKTLSGRLADIDRHYAALIRTARRREAVRHVVHLSALQWRMLVSYGWVWFRGRILCRPCSAERLSAIHRGHARRFKQLASRLKGATVKIAQFASLQHHLLPSEYIEELKTLRDRVAPSEYPLVAGSIQAELGAGPLEVFSEFDRVPLAAASMGQVHRARLATGEAVVVKLLHPGVERSVAIDLWITKATLRILNAFARRLDLMQLFEESKEPMLLELDLLHEARSTEELGRLLAPLGVGVPKVYWQYSTRRVLTLQYIEGVTIDSVERMRAWNVDRVALARTYLRAFLHQAFTGGFFHADPHPANAFCTPDGRLVLLDFGMVKRLPDHIRRGLMKEWMGAFFKNARMYVDGIIEKGAVGEADREFLEATATRILADERLRKLAFGHEVEDENTLKDLAAEGLTILEQLKTFKTPQDELMFLRGLGICFDAVREMVPEMSLMEVAEPVYAEVFQRVMAENPVYAAGPFRLTLGEADVARLLAAATNTSWLRDITITCRTGVIRAQARCPLERLGLGDVTVAVTASLAGLDTAAQIVDLEVTALECRALEQGGVGAGLIGRSWALVQWLAEALPSERELHFSWGSLTFPEGGKLPAHLRVKMSALAGFANSYMADLKLDEILIEEGHVVIAQHGRGPGVAAPRSALTTGAEAPIAVS